jgi:hypothetical protein
VAETERHFVTTILYGDRRPLRLTRSLLLALLLVQGLLGLRFALLSLAPPGVYMKDFIQEYLLAQAVVNGVNPYLPLPELADRFLDPLENPIFPHPTPHPPPVILLSLPLALFTYETAALLWLLFEILCLSGSVYLLLSWWGNQPPIGVAALVTIFLIGWGPVTDGLIMGQLMSLLLLLLCLTWTLWRAGRWQLGALLLGLAMALKLVVWPLALLLLLYRRWSALLVLAATFVAANLAAGLMVGLDVVAHYYTAVGAQVETIYRAHEGNFALWGLGWRLFFGTGSTMIGGIHAPPLIDMPEMAALSSLLILFLFLLLVLYFCVTAKRLDVRLAVLVCAAVIANPIAWSHYLVLLLIPLTVTGRHLLDLDFPRTLTNGGLIILLLLLWPRSELQRFVRLFALNDTGLDVFPAVPVVASLLTLIPLATVIGLMVFVWLLQDAEVVVEAHDRR